MTRALICHADGTMENVDLEDLDEPTRELAITHHRELELVRALLRALNTLNENPHELD